MATDKETKLVRRLLDKTRKRRLTWEPTAKEDEFLSTLGGNVSFTVASWQEADSVTIRDELGRILLSMDSNSVAQISELYAEARRQALNVDESLDRVLEQLGRLG